MDTYTPFLPSSSHSCWIRRYCCRRCCHRRRRRLHHHHHRRRTLTKFFSIQIFRLSHFVLCSLISASKSVEHRMEPNIPEKERTAIQRKCEKNTNHIRNSLALVLLWLPACLSKISQPRFVADGIAFDYSKMKITNIRFEHIL